MFYNGFNLLIDVIIGSLTCYITYRVAWQDGYDAGIYDSFQEDNETL